MSHKFNFGVIYMEKEIWVSVLGYEGLYEVSNTGKIKSLRRYNPDSGKHGMWYKERIMAINLDKDGYQVVHLSKDGRCKLCKVHRLVLSSFDRQYCDLQVNHVDGNKENNNLKNLEWVTISENIKHAYKTGLKSQLGSKNNQSKLIEEEVLEIIELFKTTDLNNREIGDRYSVNDETIRNIRKGRTWTHLTKNFKF